MILPCSIILWLKMYLYLVYAINLINCTFMNLPYVLEEQICLCLALQTMLIIFSSVSMCLLFFPLFLHFVKSMSFAHILSINFWYLVVSAIWCIFCVFFLLSVDFLVSLFSVILSSHLNNQLKFLLFNKNQYWGHFRHLIGS